MDTRNKRVEGLLLGLLALTITQTGHAAESTLKEVHVQAPHLEDPARHLAASDSAQLLSDQPGYTLAAGGGVSGLPIVNGWADDRLKITLDGAEITSACGNHMNAPFSYVAPQQVEAISLFAGVTPVSLGGDSLGGTIAIQTLAPQFAEAGEGTLKQGAITLGTRSVNDSIAASLNATAASETLSLSYSGAISQGSSYKDGQGNTVLASMYKSQNQALTLAARDSDSLLTVRVGEQRIPYQGFPNQYMDMTGNHALFANVSYARDFSWGHIDTRLYWQDTEHEMGFFTTEKTGTMPMNTHGRNMGYTLKADIPMQDQNTLRVGAEYHRFLLDDWWPAVDTMMMGPNTYKNINGGKRDRLALFAEWEGSLAADWNGLFGLRHERVSSDAGEVQSYGSMMLAADNAAAAAFNARSRARDDNNFDLTALLRYDAASTQTLEFGLAQKTRSPNLYERYSWGRSTMAMTMTNWFGDANGYVGNPDLKPEVARTLSATLDWHDAERSVWHVRLTPYFSHVQNYIDTDTVGAFNPYGVLTASGNLLQFANHDARLYGANLSWQFPLADSKAWGQLRFKGNADLTRGKRTDGRDLYRMMPLNTQIALEQRQGNWVNLLETRIVARKSRVDLNRLEPTTGGYAVVNLLTRYQLDDKITLSAGISNLFNRNYADPMGGVYLSGLKASGSGALHALPGQGRSLDLGLSMLF